MSLTRNLVNIIPKDGEITLEWSPNVPTFEVYYRHIMIVYHNKVEEVKLFIKDYISSIKAGDYYTVFYVNSQLVLKKRQFREKTMNNNDLNINNYINDEEIYSQLRQRIIQVVQKESSYYTTEPIVANILLQHSQDADWFIEKIKYRRLYNKFNFVVSLFGPFQNTRLSVSQGINQISFRQKNRLKVVGYYLKFINQATLLRARLTITCLNGVITSCDDQQWKNSAFNQIFRDYYGLPAGYLKDILTFTNALSNGGERLQLLVDLSYHCFNKTPFNARKSVKLNLGGLKIDCGCGDLQKLQPTFMDGDIQLQKSPYESRTEIRYMSELSDTQYI